MLRLVFYTRDRHSYGRLIRVELLDRNVLEQLVGQFAKLGGEFLLQLSLHGLEYDLRVVAQEQISSLHYKIEKIVLS